MSLPFINIILKLENLFCLLQISCVLLFWSHSIESFVTRYCFVIQIQVVVLINGWLSFIFFPPKWIEKEKALFVQNLHSMILLIILKQKMILYHLKTKSDSLLDFEALSEFEDDTEEEILKSANADAWSHERTDVYVSWKILFLMIVCQVLRYQLNKTAQKKMYSTEFFLKKCFRLQFGKTIPMYQKTPTLQHGCR